MSSSVDLTRRRIVLAGAAFAGLAGLAASVPRAQAQQLISFDKSDVPDLPEFRKLIAANRILAFENVVDAFGHVSVRDPRNPANFVMSRSRSPALVEPADLMVFDLKGNPLDLRGRTVYGERMIHAAIYAARPEVNSVVHSHTYSVLPFTITNVPLRPVVHAASVIGAEIPVWDIRTDFGDTDMLVRSIEQGASLARKLANNTCVLMRGHGVAVVGAGIERAVLTAIYLKINADVILQARALGESKALSDAEIQLATSAQFSDLALPRAWEYFCSRAGVEF